MGAKHERPAAVPVAARGQQLFQQAMAAPPAPPPTHTTSRETLTSRRAEPSGLDLPAWLQTAMLLPSNDPTTCTELYLRDASGNFRPGEMPTEAEWAAFPVLERVVFESSGVVRRGLQLGAQGVTAAGIAALLNCCPLLRVIDLSGANSEDSFGDLLPASLPHTYPALKIVDLEGAKGVTLEGITALLQACPNLAFLRLLKVRPRLEGVVEADCPNLNIEGGNILLLLPTKEKKHPKSAAKKVPSTRNTSKAAAAAAAPWVVPPPPGAATRAVAMQHPRFPS